MHIKACLSKEIYTQSWGQVKTTFIPVPRKANYSKAKKYHSISLLSFMQKTMQKLVARNIRGESLWVCSTYLYQSAYKLGKTKETIMHHVITHTQEAVQKRKLHLSFTRYLGSFWLHFMWQNKGCQMAWACRHTLAIDWLHAGWQKNDSHAYRRNSGGVCGQVPSTEGHFITTQLWSLVVDELIEKLGNGCCTHKYVLSSSAENSQILIHSFFRRL
jgi:hypothetical protein